MQKTIIIIYGRESEGKSSTIKKVIDIYKNLKCKLILLSNKEDYDILGYLDIDGFRIGFESQGDPNSRLTNDKSISILAENKCDIIICASRTKGLSVEIIDNSAIQYDYRTLWKSSYYAPNFNFEIVNEIAAREIVFIVNQLINNKL